MIIGILNPVCDPAQDGSYPQEDGEAPHHLFEELDDLRGFLGGCEAIGPMLSQQFSSLVKCSLGIANFLKEISSLSLSVVFLYFFAS